VDERAFGSEQARKLVHELNNHLGVIRNHAELLADALPAGQARDDVGEIQSAVEQASALAAQLLEVVGGRAR